MIPTTPKIVRISVVDGKPVATPASITVHSDHELEFEGVGVMKYQLDFHESPESGGRELFDADAQGKVKIKIKRTDVKKYPKDAPQGKWKRIKYDVVLSSGARLDPDVIIDPN